MSARATKRRSVRQMAERERKRSIYYESDTDEVDSEDSDGEADFEPEIPRPTKKRRLTRRSKPQTRAALQSRQSKRQPARPKRSKPKSADKKRRNPYMKRLGAPLKDRVKKETKFTGPSDSNIPNWTTLPLEILRDIFIFASQPMHEQTTTASGKVGWLMRAARTCRAFAVPALEAYYQSPYPLTNLQPHHLLELLQMPKEKTYIHYNVKVQSLEIDVRQLAYSATGKERLNLSSLIRVMPQLQHLEIVHPVDTQPYRGYSILRWRYPTDLFQATSEAGIRLKSWRWTRDMIPDSEVTDINAYMSLAHTSKTFEYLDRLVVCGFGVNDGSVTQAGESSEQDSPRVHALAVTVSQLAHLKDLTFISCDLIMDTFLEKLPKNLERLELSNCLEVTSNMLKTYLATGGSHLRELVLNHNSAVDLAFLPQLKTLCPRLEVLKMDLTYYSERHNYNDAWAMYDQLLTENDIPTWPSTLRHLELVNLQKWSAEAAQNLFRSLVDGAKDLPDLRYLVIQAHINIPWRDRAQFRDQWIERLDKVYLRQPEEPNPFLGSFRQYRLYKRAVADGHTVADAADLDTDEEPVTRRKLSHVRVTPRKATTDAEGHPDPGPSEEKPQRAAARRSVRVAELAESLSVSAPTEDDISSGEDEEGSEEWNQQPEAFIQGLCQVVDIRIDNQRPRENQYTEANFLDSEPSGDEDWHSGAELSDDGYAW